MNTKGRRSRTHSWLRGLSAGLLVLAMASLSACSDPQVYGSVGISSGWGGSGFGSGVHTSISVGGRIR